MEEDGIIDNLKSYSGQILVAMAIAVVVIVRAAWFLSLT